MGRAIAASIATRDDLALASLWVRDTGGDDFPELPDRALISADVSAVAQAADVLIDFSLPEGTTAVLAAATDAGKPLVCGVSGLGEKQLAAMQRAADSIAIVFDRNMSLGIAVLQGLVTQAATALGGDFDIEVQETHHVHKLDAPSGTALKLGEALAAARGTAADDIHYEVERRGEVPGDHTVVFRSPNETLTFTHSVTTRDVFAEGALRAATWIVHQTPGLYSMRDVLGVT